MQYVECFGTNGALLMRRSIKTAKKTPSTTKTGWKKKKQGKIEGEVAVEKGNPRAKPRQVGK